MTKTVEPSYYELIGTDAYSDFKALRLPEISIKINKKDPI